MKEYDLTHHTIILCSQTYDIADPQYNVRVRHDNIEAQDIDDMIQLR